jgi:serine/threonine-protein kinase RsbW
MGLLHADNSSAEPGIARPSGGLPVTYYALNVSDATRWEDQRRVRKAAWVNDPPDSPRLEPNEVEIRMLARMDRVPGIRAMAADLAMRADFDLDAISDLRLAVEEACATVLANTDPDSELVCRLLVSSDKVEISAHVPLPDHREPSVAAFSLRILRTLSDSVDYWTSRVNGQRLFHVQLTRSP